MKTFIIALLIVLPLTLFAQAWGDKVEKVVRVVTEPSEKEKNPPPEATWNIDFEGISFIMPDQPAGDQMLSTLTGFGTTYKFSDKIHLAGKWEQFDVEGKSEITWSHNHILAGVGMRGFFGENQQWQINALTGMSEVSGSKGVGSIKNLEQPLFIEIKWFTVFGDGNFMIGPQITFARVPNACNDPNGTYVECGHGGYASISVSLQIGIPEKWGE